MPKKSGLLRKYCGFALLSKQGQLPHSDFRKDVHIPIPAKTGTHSCRLQITNGLGQFCVVENCFCDAIDGFAGLVVRVAGFVLFCSLGKPTLVWSAAKDQKLVVNFLLFSQLLLLLLGLHYYSRMSALAGSIVYFFLKLFTFFDNIP